MLDNLEKGTKMCNYIQLRKSNVCFVGSHSKLNSCIQACLDKQKSSDILSTACNRNRLVASCEQAVDKLSTSNAMQTRPDNKLIKLQHWHKSAAGMSQLVRFLRVYHRLQMKSYFCMCSEPLVVVTQQN